MNHALINRIRRLVRENTGRQTRDHLGALVVLGDFKDVVGHQHVVPVEVGFVFHVGEEAADFSGEVDDVGGVVFGKDLFDVLEFSVVRARRASDSERDRNHK